MPHQVITSHPKGFTNTQIIIGVVLLSIFTISLIIGTNWYLNQLSTQTENISPLPDQSELPTVSPTLSEPTLTLPPPEPVTRTDTISIVLFGKGGDGHSGGNLTDSITQLVFIPKQLTAALISIPRDTFVQVNGQWQKINRVYSDNPTNSKKIIGDVTGIPVQYIVAIDFSHLISLIDSFGGIDIDIPASFTDQFFPIAGQEDNLCGKSPEEMIDIHKKYTGFQLEKQFTCRYETLTFTKGPAHLNGATTLKFLRSRHSAENGSDFARLLRSQAVLVSLSKAVIAKLPSTNIPTLFAQFKKLVETDLSPAIISSWPISPTDYSQYKIIKISLGEDLLVPGTGPSGEFTLDPKSGRGGWGPIHDYVSSKLP